MTGGLFPVFFCFCLSFFLFVVFVFLFLFCCKYFIKLQRYRDKKEEREGAEMCEALAPPPPPNTHTPRRINSRLLKKKKKTTKKEGIKEKRFVCP